MRLGFTVCLPLVLLLVAGGCANGNFSGGSGGGAEPSPSGEGEKGEELGNPEDDSADKSSPVSGAYLACIQIPAKSDDQAEYGCDLVSDKTKAQVPLADVATSWKWRGVIPAGAPTDLEVAVTENQKDHQAVFAFSGGNGNTEAYAEVSQIALDATLKKEVPEFDGFRKKLQEILVSNLGDPIDIGPDADGDRIPDTEDRCSNTPAGAYAHPDGEYVGCAGGQFRDSDVKK